MRRLATALFAVLGLGCAGASPPSDGSMPEAGFVTVPARDVTIAGRPVRIAATARLFFNFWPAESEGEQRPLLVLFNGFADDIVRPYGTGPFTVIEGGAVVPNPTSFTRFANILYVEPRQAGYSYDVRDGLPASEEDCAPEVFDEHVDAADVLLAVLAFVDAHPRLAGPVYWLGESYGGVRTTWILSYLRTRWELSGYADPVLVERLAGVTRPSSLFAGQILLEGWLGGLAENDAIQAECSDPAQIRAVAASIGVSCGALDACSCAQGAGRSLYNFEYTAAHQAARVFEGDLAHTLPDRAAALLGVPLTSIALLASGERSRGFKCSPPDSTVPGEDALVAALGRLPDGQAYFVPYSPLLPSKQIAPTTADWYSKNDEARAFVDNLRDVPAFVTRGDLDLVVPDRALAPALRAVLGSARVDDSSTSRLGIIYPDGERFADVFDYPGAGHMISMLAPQDLARDVEGWLAAQPR
jgi:hypothetical protein